MKVIVEYEDGTRETLGEIKELKAIPGNARALVVQAEGLLRSEDMEKMGRKIEETIKMPTLVLDSRVKQLYVMP